MVSWLVLPAAISAQPAPTPDPKLAACLAEPDPEKRLGCFEALAKATPPPAPPGPAAAPAVAPYEVTRNPDGSLSGAGKWIVHRGVDSLTDKPRIRLMTSGEAENSVTLNKPVLGIVCFNGKIEVVLNSGSFIGSRDTFRTTFRFDSAPPQTQQWIISTTGQAVFAPAPGAFLSQLVDAGRVVTEVADFNGRTYRSIFDNAGIKDAIAEVAACWRPTVAQPAKPTAAAKPPRG